MRKRVLIVANGFVNDASRALPAELRAFAEPDCEMHVVVPHTSPDCSRCAQISINRAPTRTIASAGSCKT